MWEERDRERRLPKVLRSGQALTPTVYTEAPQVTSLSTLYANSIGQHCVYTSHHTTSHHISLQPRGQHSTCPPPSNALHHSWVCEMHKIMHTLQTHTYTKLPDLLTVEQLQLTVESQLKTPIDNVHWCGPTTKGCVECLPWSRHVHLSKHKGQTNGSQGRYVKCRISEQHCRLWDMKRIWNPLKGFGEKELP